MTVRTKMRAFDPRDKRQTRFDARTWKETSNPALIVGTLARKRVYELILSGQFTMDEYWKLIGEIAEEFN